jgi:DNA-binding MarR family transcriptional regulator
MLRGFMIFNRIGEELGYLIKEVQQELRKKMDKTLSTIGLTTPQYAVLSQLREYPGLSNAELARKSFVTPQTMNLIIKNLEERKLVIRTAASNHGKILKAEVSEAGLALLEKGNDLIFEVEELVFGKLSQRESANLKKALKKLRNINF